MYPNRNPAWKQALLIIDFQGNTRKGSSTSLSDEYFTVDSLNITSLTESNYFLIDHSEIINLQYPNPFEGLHMADTASSELSKLISLTNDPYEQLLINNVISSIQLVQESGDIDRFKADISYLNLMWETQYQGEQIDEYGPYLSACVLGILKGSLDLWEEDLPIGDSDLAINIVLADLCGLAGSLYIGIGTEVFFGGADMTSSDISAIVASSIVSGIFSSATGGFGLLGKLMKWP